VQYGIEAASVHMLARATVPGAWARSMAALLAERASGWQRPGRACTARLTGRSASSLPPFSRMAAPNGRGTPQKRISVRAADAPFTPPPASALRVGTGGLRARFQSCTSASLT